MLERISLNGILYDIFAHEYHQFRVTLFDSPDDDDYDGDLDQNDEECPKALINFNIEPINNILSNKLINETVEPARSKMPTPEEIPKSRDEELFNIVKDFIPEVILSKTTL